MLIVRRCTFSYSNWISKIRQHIFYLPSADVWLSGSHHTSIEPGYPHLLWSRVEHVHNTHTDHPPPKQITIHSKLQRGTNLHIQTYSKLLLARSICIWLEGHFSTMQKTILVYLAGEHRLDHLCILAGKHWASQAEDHTHCRQQHEQWDLWRDMGMMSDLKLSIETICNQVTQRRGRFYCLPENRQ